MRLATASIPYKRWRFQGLCALTECAKPFKSCHPHKLYCSRRCRYNAAKKDFLPIYPTLSTGTAGAIGELRVATDLLVKGFEVFRAVSPSCSCDLVTLFQGKPRRVEVRTGHYGKNRIIYCAKPIDTGRYDILAIVLPDNIIYRPDLG